MARNIGVNFNGRHIVKPGAYSMIDASGLGQTGSNTNKTIVFVGSSVDGEPNKIHFFRNEPDARKVLRGGDLLTAGQLAWSPSGDGIGAGRIGFLRVEDAVRATLVKGALKLQSKMWGEISNRIQAKLEDGSIPNSKRLSLYFYPDNHREVYDNIGPIFKIKYIGPEAYASLTITKDTNGKANKLIIKAGEDAPSAVELIVYNLGEGEFADTNKLVKDLNEHPFIEASLVPVGNKNVPTETYDEVNEVSITTEYTVMALKGDFLHQTRFSTLVEIEFDDTKEFPENFNYEYLTGGSDGTVPASWASKFELIRGSGAYIVVPLTADEAIHAECARFIERQTTEENREMRGFYGGALGESIDKAIARAVTLNSERATLCYPGITRNAPGGEIETLPPYFTAALVAGRVAGLAVGEPATLDFLNLIGVEKVLTKVEIEQLLEAGVTPIEYVQQANRRGFRIAQCITTYQGDANPVYRENSVGEIADFMNAELREHLEAQFAGTKGVAISPSLIKNATQSFLDRKVKDGWIVEYLPESVNVVIDGDVVEVGYSAMPAFSLNYILIKGRFYRKTLTTN